MSDSVESGVPHPANTLNDLTAKSWVKATKSWFSLNPSPRPDDVAQHPATFPPELAARYVEFFTKAGMNVLDPFVGTGATLAACTQLGRRGVGIDVNERWATIARQHGQPVIVGDACAPITRLDLALEGFDRIDFTFTSPPYWDMLSHSRGGANSTSKSRRQQGLPTTYTSAPLRGDLSNMADYGAFCQSLVEVFDLVADLTVAGRYCAVVAQNIRVAEGHVVPFAWDLVWWLTQSTESRPWQFVGEQIYCNDNKPLRIWGHPRTFVTNVHHHYVLVFQRI